jgi:hypothetical protein
MNEAKPLDVIWFETPKGRVGVVKVETDREDVEYRIGIADGFLRHMDVQQLIAWGVHFPKEAGEVLMTAKD